jgi:hypothetical protein
MSLMARELVQLRMMRILFCLILFALPLGCVKRTLSITTTPPNALVWLNDREVGRTPLKVGFLYYGEYDIRIQHEDTESLMTTRWVTAPWWDAPFVDIAAEAIPVEINSAPSLHFDLELKNNNLGELVNRANSFRGREIGEQE